MGGLRSGWGFARTPHPGDKPPHPGLVHQHRNCPRKKAISDNSCPTTHNTAPIQQLHRFLPWKMSSIAHMLMPQTQPETLSEDQKAVDAADDKQQQRKRSKVSRACDECRRKKVRCDATFSMTSSTVLKPCTNCTKNNDTCSFERVPLKRGPSKGFVRSDPVSDAVAERSRTSSFQQQNIVLPPLTSLTRGSESQPDSPRNSMTFGENNPVPQGLFWKVPYQGPFERRGSIDSINSSSTGPNGYRINYESSVISDSDDDAVSQRRSRSNSSNLQLPASPSLSISSLKTFNSGFAKKMTLDPQLIDIYYQCLHPTFPILPLNKQSLSNLLAIPPASNPEISETNATVIQSFYLCLEVLITASSRSSSRNDDIHTLFASLFRIFSKIHSSNLYSQNVMILLASSLVLLCYAVTLLGIPTDVNINSTVAVFNKSQFFKLFWDPSHAVTNTNYDDYNSLVKRLYIQLSILDSLQSLSFGSPKCINFPVDVAIVETLFPNFANFELTKNNMKLGILFNQICETKDYTKPYQPASCPKTNPIVKEVDQDGLTWNIWELITCKFDMMSYLDELAKETSMDDESLHDYQLKCSRLVRKNLTTGGLVLSSIKNHTNSIDNNMLVSPYIPLVFKQCVKLLNINKLIINSLQTNKDLIPRLSKLLNEVISLNNYLSLLKPFKLDEMNNHLKFDFHSTHVAWLDEEEVSTSLSHWLGLMKDVDFYLRSDDYDGWF